MGCGTSALKAYGVSEPAELPSSMTPRAPRALSLPASVAAAGGIYKWNSKHDLRMSTYGGRHQTIDDALVEVRRIMFSRDYPKLWSYEYMRMLYAKQPGVFYSLLLKQPGMLLPVVYPPIVGEACQKFGKLAMSRRGCYVSIKDRGNVKVVIEEYAAAELTKGPDNKYGCDCIVFSDGGRNLGLGDLGAWGMGIPIGKLDLYTVCAGVNPYRTMPVILDAGCLDPAGNTDRLAVRDDDLYTGLRQDRQKNTSPEGTLVNTSYFEANSFIDEFMKAACDVFGERVLLQFEGFNSNDAFPLLAQYRDKYLTYNDDIQGTAAVAVAALFGAIKLRKPDCPDLITEMRSHKFLFHGSGSANLGTMKLLAEEVGVPKSQIFATNSKGLMWVSEDGSEGNFKNSAQKEFAQIGEPSFDCSGLLSVIENVKPVSLVGAVGVAPGCFDEKVVDAMLRANEQRPSIFALSNPKTKAEITAADAITWSKGRVIYGSWTAFDPIQLDGKTFEPGQVNSVYIFPGVSFGAIYCQAKKIPESFFMVAAEAVARSLTSAELEVDRCIPRADRLREVGLNVAAAVALQAQKEGLAGKSLGGDEAEVKKALQVLMWCPAEMSTKGLE